MRTEFEVIVERMLSPNEARAWREPDAEFPRGRAYGIQLERVVDDHGHRQVVSAGDRVRVTVDAEGRGRIESATLVHPTAISGAFAVA